MLNGCADFIVDDLRPAYALEGGGLRKLLSAFSTVHMAHQPIDLNEVSFFLPNRTVVTKHIDEIADKIREELKQVMQYVFGEHGSGGAIALDLWTDSYRQTAYMGVILHYINEGWEMCQCTLANQPLPSDKKKDHVYILSVLREILASFGIDLGEIKDKIVFITDRAGYFLKAFESFNHVACVLHFLSNSVERLYRSGRPKELLDICMKIVTYVKKTGKSDQFNPTLKSSCDVRWNSAVFMMKSIVAGHNYEILCQILADQEKMNLLGEATKEEIENLINLTKGKLATKAMETTNKPTLFAVLAWYEKLEKTIEYLPEDPAVVREAKENVVGYFLVTKEEFKAVLRGKYHSMSVFLHPAMKTMVKSAPIHKEATVKDASILICISLTNFAP